MASWTASSRRSGGSLRNRTLAWVRTAGSTDRNPACQPSSVGLVVWGTALMGEGLLPGRDRPRRARPRAGGGRVVGHDRPRTARGRGNDDNKTNGAIVAGGNNPDA